MSDSLLHKTALNKAMAICSRREYCTGDIRTKLNSWGVSIGETEKIIASLVKENFINDTRYANAYVKDKLIHNKWGKLKIISHLRAKNIPDEIVKSSIADIDDENYRKSVKEIISAHRRFIKAKNQYDLKGKLLRFGLSKGFESHLLYDILNETD